MDQAKEDYLGIGMALATQTMCSGTPEHAFCPTGSRPADQVLFPVAVSLVIAKPRESRPLPISRGRMPAFKRGTDLARMLNQKMEIGPCTEGDS